MICTLKTGIHKKEHKNINKLKIIFNENNLGVGGAVKIGYQESLNDNADIIVKIDGDNQMDPNEIKKIIDLIKENYDMSKGIDFE